MSVIAIPSIGVNDKIEFKCLKGGEGLNVVD